MAIFRFRSLKIVGLRKKHRFSKINLAIDATEDYTQSQKALFDGTNIFRPMLLRRNLSLFDETASTKADSFGRRKT